jgi:lysophospholipase L1-like esterase
LQLERNPGILQTIACSKEGAVPPGNRAVLGARFFFFIAPGEVPMKIRRLIGFLAVLGVVMGFEVASAPAVQDQKPDVEKKAGEEKKQNTAIIPKSFQPKRHEGFLEIAKKGDIDVLLMGDSITDGWRNAGKAVFEKHFVPLKTANFGIGGDKTQGVLWRMENGELEGYTPKLMMLMIGTNNIGGNSPEQIAEGIQAIVTKFRTKFPEAKVLLLAVFPRNVNPESKQRLAVKEINKIIAKFDDGKSVRYLDIGDKFLDKDGTLPKDIMPDALHPNAKGYQIWADAVMPTVYEMLGKKQE